MLTSITNEHLSYLCLSTWWHMQCIVSIYLPGGLGAWYVPPKHLLLRVSSHLQQGGVEVWYGMIWYVPSKHLLSSVVHTIIRVGRKLPSLGNISNPDNLSSGEILPKSKFLSNQLSHCILSPNTWWFNKTCITGIWCHYLNSVNTHRISPFEENKATTSF